MIDNALRQSAKVDYGIDFADFERESIKASTPIYKLHGSLNWLHCPSCNNVSLTQGEKAVAHFTEDSPLRLCGICNSIMTFIIVPPTYYKDLSKVFLNILWHKAEAVLREADHFIFCGYSFPDADMHVKYLLKRAEINRQQVQPLRLTIINNHKGKEGEQKQQEKNRYERFFKNKINYTSSTFEDFAKEPQKFYSH